MLLTIDIGNTNVVFAVFDGEDKSETVRVTSDLNFLSALVELKRFPIDGAIISSVVPRLTPIYCEALKNLFRLDPYCVTPETAGIRTAVGHPEEIGADRICNIIAAIAMHGTPAIVVDFGTATTYDVIDEEDTFLGGAIAPGIDVSARYLFEKAALLRETAFTIPKSAIGTDTTTNLQAGIMFGAIDEVEGMLKRIRLETGWEQPQIILTGGFSPLISKGLSVAHTLAPDLTLIGMRLIYERSTDNE